MDQGGLQRNRGRSHPKNMPCGLFSDVFRPGELSRAFYDTINFEARQARLHYSQKTTTATNIPEGEQKHPHSPSESEDIELGSPSTKHARLTSGAPSGTGTPTGPESFATLPSPVSTNLVTNLQQLLQGGPAQIFLDSNGALTTTAVPNKSIVSTLHFQIHQGKD